MFELYSKRIKNEFGEPEIFIYNDIPSTFRTQFFYALTDLINNIPNYYNDVWEIVYSNYLREKGIKSMGSNYGYNATILNIEEYIDHSESIDLLDFIDFSIFIIHQIYHTSQHKEYDKETESLINDFYTEINYRLKSNNLGYECNNHRLIRIDNKFLHQDVIKPSLKLLYDLEFEGAEQEFLDAFEKRRIGDNKGAIQSALKAFESTIKTICDKCHYTYNPSQDTAKVLIKTLEDNNFYPSYMNNHLSHLRNTLESGLPVLRNKNTGHGQGTVVINISDEFTEYALHLAATNILLLVKIYQSNQKEKQ